MPPKRPALGPLNLQCAQVIRHVTELPDHFGVAKIAGSRITGTTERNRADVTILAR